MNSLLNHSGATSEASRFMSLSGNLEWQAVPGADPLMESGFRQALRELKDCFRALYALAQKAARAYWLTSDFDEADKALALTYDNSKRIRYTIKRLESGLLQATSAQELKRFEEQLRLECAKRA